MKTQIVFVAALLLALSAEALCQSQPAGVKLKVADGSGIDPTSLAVSPAAGRFSYNCMAFTPGRPPAATLHLADLARGEEMDISKTISDAKQIRFSPDGRRAIVLAGKRMPDALWLLDLATMKAEKIATGPMFNCCWIGDRVAINSADAQGVLQPVRVYSPTTGQTAALETVGMVIGSDTAGKTLIAAVDPNAPTAKASMRDLDARLSLARLDPNGQVVKVLASASILSSQPLVSDSGKYVAFQSKPAGEPEGPDAKYSITVVNTFTGQTQSAQDPSMPIWVSDTGMAVIHRFGTHGANLLTWQAGKTRKLTEAAEAAAVAGGTLYYIDSEALTLRSVKL